MSVDGAEHSMGNAFGRPFVVIMVVSTTILVGLLFPAVSGATSINGDPLTIAADGVGNMQVRLAGFSDGELEPASAGLAAGAGLCLWLNGGIPVGPCGNPASTSRHPS